MRLSYCDDIDRYYKHHQAELKAQVQLKDKLAELVKDTKNFKELKTAIMEWCGEERKYIGTIY